MRIATVSPVIPVAQKGACGGIRTTVGRSEARLPH
jgi:hypothetical protein